MDRTFARRIAAALSLLGVVATHASAHDKDFGYSVDWVLPYKGEREIETWSTYVPRSNDFEQLVKFEYGVTDHFTIEPAVEFQKPNGENLNLVAAELEAYYNFRDFGYGKLLPALEGEVERLVDEVSEDEPSRVTTSLRGIVSVYTEAGEDFTVNVEVARTYGGETGWEGLLTGGYLRPLDFIPGITTSKESPVKAGLEFTQSLSEQHFTSAGPVVTWKAAASINLVLTGLIALNHRDENFDEIRLILEWEF